MTISADDLPAGDDPSSKTCDNLKFSVRDDIRPAVKAAQPGAHPEQAIMGAFRAAKPYPAY